MSAKDNFAQAMKELLNSADNVAPTDAEENKPAPSSFSSFSPPESRPPRAPAPSAPKEEEPSFGDAAVPEEMDVAEELEQPVEAVAEMETAEPQLVEEPPPEPAFDTLEPPSAETALEEEEDTMAESAGYETADSMDFEDLAAEDTTTGKPAGEFTSSFSGPAPAVTTDDVTIIAQGTTIVGDITTGGGLHVGGDIKGNLHVATRLELTGKVIGDIEAEDAVITASVIRGNVKARSAISMDGGTTIIGDVSAKNVEINGKIKGNLTVEDRAHFESRAVLVGNLSSGTVIIDEGAMLKGDIAITNAQNENIAVEEPDFDIEI